VRGKHTLCVVALQAIKQQSHVVDPKSLECVNDLLSTCVVLRVVFHVVFHDVLSKLTYFQLHSVLVCCVLCVVCCVQFIFQPAEEKGNGANEMVMEGVLENPFVDEVVSSLLVLIFSYVLQGRFVGGEIHVCVCVCLCVCVFVCERERA